MYCKRLFSTLMVTAVAVAMMAIPAKRGMWSTIKLADGTVVSAQKAGDEHQRWMQTADGMYYVKNSNGTYEQVSMETLTANRQQRSAARHKVISASTSDGLGKKGTMSRGAVPSIGEFKIPVVMVQFQDTKFQTTTTVEKMNRFYNEEGYHDEADCKGSVRDYFKAQSGGQFVPTFEVVGIVTLSKKASYYGGNGYSGNDQALDELPGDVVKAAKTQLGADFSQYVVPAGDSYHEAGVPLLCMFYAGYGEATEPEGTADDTIWPCEWDCDTNYEGVHFNSCFVGNELLSYRDENKQVTGNTLMGMGVFCHEFGHALGLPDFYVTDYSYSNDDAFGNWSIMDTGAYLDDECRAPMGYNAYEKSYMGWLDLKEVGMADEIVLQLPEGLAENSAYIIRNSSNECFIFENRQPGTWYPEDLGSGVMVTRIAYSYNYWRGNTLNNTQSKKRACILTADGSKLYYSADNANLYGNGKNSITSLKTLNGTNKNIGINAIAKNDDGTITLTFKEGSSEGGGTETPTGDVLFYESFNSCDGTGGNDDQWTSSVAGKTTDFHPDNSEWNYVVAYGGYECARFGSSKKSGQCMTPAFLVPNESVLTFKAAAWTGDPTSLKLGSEGATVIFEPAEVTMKNGEWTEFTVKMSGAGTTQIVFTPSKRFFLDEVKVVKDTTTGIESVAARQQSQRIYTLDGRFAGTDFNALNRGLYIVNGRKVVK